MKVVMKIIKNIRLSWRAIFLNKSRTIFAIIGISIGITSVIVMAAIGLGARREIDDQFTKMGVNLIIINSGKTDNSILRTPETNRVMTLKLKDARAIEEQCSDVDQVMPSVDGSLKVKYKGVSSTTLVFGVTANFPEVNNFQVSYGRFFSDMENKL